MSKTKCLKVRCCSNSRRVLCESTLRTLIFCYWITWGFAGKSQAISSKGRIWEMRCHKLCVDKVICTPSPVSCHIYRHRQLQDVYLHGRLNWERGVSLSEQEKVRNWGGIRPSQNRALLEIMVSAFSLYLRLTKNEKTPIKTLFFPSLGRRQIGTALSRKWEDWRSQWI